MTTRPRSPRLPANPFEFGLAIHASAVVNRQDEVERITQAVRNRERLFLIGPRRYGKTSILNVVEHRLTADGVVILRADAEKFENAQALATALLASAVRALSGPLDKAGEVVRRFFGALRPEVTYNLGEQTLAVQFTATRTGREPHTSDVPLLTEVLDGINAMAGAHRTTVAVILDEFQQLVATGGITAERQLRAAVQTHQHLSYVFAGSKTRLLVDMTSDHARPFYRMGSTLFVGPLPQDEFLAFLRRGFARGGYHIAEGAAEHLLDVAEDVPYNVQRLAHRCWELLRTTSAGLLTAAFVDRVLERLVLENDTVYTQLWTGLTEVQKKALKAVIGTRGHNLLSQMTTRTYGVAPASMQKALKVLEHRGLTREEQNLGTVRIRLDDPFFATWLRLSQQGYSGKGP